MIVKGQRVFLRGLPAVVMDCGLGYATLEIDGGRVEIVTKAELVTAESVERAKAREGVQ